MRRFDPYSANMDKVKKLVDSLVDDYNRFNHGIDWRMDPLNLNLAPHGTRGADLTIRPDKPTPASPNISFTFGVRWKPIEQVIWNAIRGQ